MRAFLPVENLQPFLNRLNSKMEVIVPVVQGEAVTFVSWKGQTPALKKNSLLSPLEFLFPQKEVLFRYIQESGSYTFEDVPPVPRLIFGIRPCDLKAIAVLDKILGSKPRDSAYFGRRECTALAVQNCMMPNEGCFCSSMDSGPDALEGFDLLFTELDYGYLVETGSPAGVLMLKDCSHLLQEAAASHISEKLRRLKSAKEAFVNRPEKIIPKIRQAIKEADWDKLGRQCLSCGGCTFVCPICHCFSITDLGVPDGERMRCKDSCILSGFSRMAGGANPRRSAGERMHNWYLDKFEYIPEKTGLAGCVGCGRCSKACLAEIDRWVLEAKR